MSTHHLLIQHSYFVLQVPEYQAKGGEKTKERSHWKPKHHFAQHIASDMARCGPARGYWCFSYEGFNKKIKKSTRHSNFKNVCKRIAEQWVLRSARKA